MATGAGEVVGLRSLPEHLRQVEEQLAMESMVGTIRGRGGARDMDCPVPPGAWKLVPMEYPITG
jgi:hypothetical protein